jgi:hypothetical protein
MLEEVRKILLAENKELPFVQLLENSKQESDKQAQLFSFVSLEVEGS